MSKYSTDWLEMWMLEALSLACWWPVLSELVRKGLPAGRLGQIRWLFTLNPTSASVWENHYHNVNFSFNLWSNCVIMSISYMWQWVSDMMGKWTRQSNGTLNKELLSLKWVLPGIRQPVSVCYRLGQENILSRNWITGRVTMDICSNCPSNYFDTFAGVGVVSFCLISRSVECLAPTT